MSPRRRSAPVPVAGRYPIDTGTAELVEDRFAGGWLVSVNDAQSSHIDPDEPESLDFEYMRQMTAIVDEHFPDRQARLQTLHLGAAACALPRAWGHRYPQSRHLAVEIDAELARLAREWFDLPRSPRLRIRVGDAREVLGGLPDASRDVVVRDAFAGDRTPEHLTTVEFTEQVRRVLRPGGIYLANCGDRRDLRRARAETATLAEVFGSVAAVADPAMFNGRRTGNVVLVGADRPLTPSPALVRTLLADPQPSRIMHGRAIRDFGSAPALRDG